MLDSIKFKSIFKNELISYLKYKRSLGYDYKNEVNIIKYYDNKLISLKTKKINKTDFYKITERNNKSYSSYIRYYHIFNDFCIFMNTMGYKNIYFENKKFHYESNYQPIVFDEEEIKALFKAMDDYTKNSRIKFYKLHFTFSIMFRLAYSCGLRISEIINLNYEDVDFINNSIKIIESKNHVSRIVVFSDSMKKCLLKYIQVCNIQSDLLFRNRKNKKINYWSLRKYYKDILKNANLNTNAKIHELRHVFVNFAFNQMLEKGYDEDAIIVYLHKYLGHQSIHETEYYLHFIDYNKEKILKANDNLSQKLYEGIDFYNE